LVLTTETKVGARSGSIRTADTVICEKG